MKQWFFSTTIGFLVGINLVSFICYLVLFKLISLDINHPISMFFGGAIGGAYYLFYRNQQTHKF